MSTLFLTILALICAGCTAWSPGTTPRHDRKLDRRGFISSAIIGTTIINTSSLVAHAASKDEENIVKGYNRLQYLLDNWEEEVCACVYKSFLYEYVHIMFIFYNQTYLYIYTLISHCRLLFAKLDKRYVYVFLFVYILCSFIFSKLKPLFDTIYILY